MLTAETRVATDRASRYLTQLSRHAGHMGRRHVDRAQHAEGHRPQTRENGGPPAAVEHAEWSDTQGIIRFAGGQCTLLATPDALVVRVEAVDVEQLRRMQDGITRRIETIGRRDGLTLDWSVSEAPDEESGQTTGDAPARTVTKRRGRLQMLGLIAAGGMLVVMHLGPLAALVTVAWAKGLTDVVLVLILLKLITVAGHGAMGFWAVRRRKQGKPVLSRKWLAHRVRLPIPGLGSWMKHGKPKSWYSS